VALALGVALGGCAQVEELQGQAQQVQGQAEQLRDQAGAALAEARDLGELTVEQVRGFDWSALDRYEGVFLGDNSRVTELLRSMPSGPDMESFAIRGDEGTLVVEYGDRAAEVDPAVLRETMSEVAAQAKERVRNLETVEFHVGDEVYTF